MAPQNSTVLQEDDSNLLSNIDDLLNNCSVILRPSSQIGSRLYKNNPTAFVDEILIPDESRKSAWKVGDENEDDLASDDQPNEDEEEEIPIWIRNEPRYVSGITELTTCDDVIAALINDEISNIGFSNVEKLKHNVDDYVITERWRDVESELSGDTAILPLWQAWGTAQKDVRFKLKINKNKIREKVIEDEIHKKVAKKEKLTLVTKLIRRVLKQGDYIQKHLFVLKDKGCGSGVKINRYNKNTYNKKSLCDVYKSSNTNLSSTSSYSKSSLFDCNLTIRNKYFERITPNNYYITDDLCKGEPKLLENVSFEPLDHKFNEGHALEDIVRTDDELLLVIENKNVENTSSNTIKHDNDSGNGSIACGSKTKSQYSNLTLNELLTDTDSNSIGNDLEITNTPKRKKRTRDSYKMLHRHALNDSKVFERVQELNESHSELDLNLKNDKLDEIRFEIKLKMTEIKQLLLKEEILLTHIQKNCAKYKAENELYNSRNLDLHVDEIQRNLDICAQEIIQYEQDLFSTKLEVENKAYILQELKLLLQSLEKQPITKDTEYKSNKNPKLDEPIRRRYSMEHLEFVDNIYEFCDNNKSMIV